jgi:hypothetical protein
VALLGWRTVLVVLGALSILPPYIGPPLGLDLDVADSVEVVDHVVPGVLIVISGSVALVLARRGEAESAAVFAATAVCFLAALWDAVSHLPLWLDAGEAGKPWDAVVLHATLGPLTAVLAGWLLLRQPEAE